MDSQIIFQTIAIVIPAIVAIAGAVKAFSEFRSGGFRLKSPSALKTAIEIYNILDSPELDNQRRTIKAYIDTTITEIYKKPVQRRKPWKIRIYSWVCFVVGIFTLIGFTYWTMNLLSDGFNWAAVITSYLAFAGLLYFLASFSEKLLVLFKIRSRKSSKAR